MSSNGSFKSKPERKDYPKSNGSGKFWTEKDKKSPKSPDKTGNLEIMGEYCKISIWVQPDGSENITTRPMTDDELDRYLKKKAEIKANQESRANQYTSEIRKNIEPPNPSVPMPDPNIDDEIPF